MDEACQFSVTVKMGRKECLEKMGRKHRERRIVVDGWHEGKETGVSYARVVVGAEDKVR